MTNKKVNFIFKNIEISIDISLNENISSSLYLKNSYFVSSFNNPNLYYYKKISVEKQSKAADKNKWLTTKSNSRHRSISKRRGKRHRNRHRRQKPRQTTSKSASKCRAIVTIIRLKEFISFYRKSNHLLNKSIIDYSITRISKRNVWFPPFEMTNVTPSFFSSMRAFETSIAPRNSNLSSYILSGLYKI